MQYSYFRLLLIGIPCILSVHQEAIGDDNTAPSNNPTVSPLYFSTEHPNLAREQSTNQRTSRHAENNEDGINLIKKPLNEKHNTQIPYEYVGNKDNENFTRPENRYKCLPCVCTNKSDGVQVAACENRNISGVPQNLTRAVEILTLTECSIKELDTKGFLIYQNLKTVNISKNIYLTRITRGLGLKESSSVVTLNICNNRIKDIESFSFMDIANLKILTLSGNRLNNLTNKMFTGLKSLMKLDVSGNNISFIDNQTFDDLKSLRILDISANLLQINDPLLLPPSAFLKINQLEEIYIQGNCKKQTTSCQFPTLVINQLKGLKKLGVDVHHEDGFRPGDTDLLHLQTLVIDLKSFCKIEFIKWNFFDKTPNLISLTIQNCPLLRLHPKAYAKLLNLENLTLNSLPPYYDLKLALDDLQGLQNSSLKYLSLSGLNVYNCVERNLDAKNGQYLRYLNLIELDISNNNIITILPGFVDMLPKTLKKLDLSGNDLSAGLMYRPLIFSEELTELNLSYQSYQFISRCPEMYRKSDGNTTTENEDFLNNENYEPDNSLPKRTCTSNESTFIDIADDRSRVLQDEQRLKTNSSTFYFPKYLKVWNGIQFPEFGIQIFNPDFENNSSLIEINFSGSFLNFWGSSHLLRSIKKADLSNNFCENISMNFIPENSSLEHLSISNNFLGLFFRTDTEGLTLSKAKQLKYLDVSRNAINVLSLFSRLDHLQTLIASENRLQIINCSFSHMKDLRIIDFSQNSITWISRRSRDDLDLIASDHEVYLDLTSNPLLCSCEGIELIRWLATTKVFLLNRDFLVCKNETNELQEIGDLAERVKHLNIQCTSKITTVLISVFSSITFCLVLALALTYRYRWKLRYLRSIALAKLLNWNKLDARDTFRFDAYILYTDETRRFVLKDCVRELEQNRGKTICIEEFNFLPDTNLIQNIVSAVQNSFKTVVIVTPEFYQDTFSEYRVKMALVAEIYARRSILYLCMYEPTDVTDLSKDFLDVTNRGDVIEFPPRDGATEEIDQQFWDGFSKVISQD